MTSPPSSWYLGRTSATAALLVVLTACGSSESLGTDVSDGPSSTVTAEPSDGADGTTGPTETNGPTEGATDDAVRVTGDGYTYVVPEGWEEIIDDPRASDADTFVRATEAVDGFATNINTVVTPAAGIDELAVGSPELPQLREQFATSTQTQTGVRPRPVDDIELDGSFAIGHTVSEYATQGRQLGITQYLTVRDEVSYVVTVTWSAGASDAAARAGQTVLDSWTWQ